jgi:hypothetical protein
MQIEENDTNIVEKIQGYQQNSKKKMERILHNLRTITEQRNGDV